MKISVRLIKSIMAEGTNCDKGKIHCIICCEIREGVFFWGGGEGNKFDPACMYVCNSVYF